MNLFLILMGFVPLIGNSPELSYSMESEESNYASGIPVITYHQISLHQSAYSATPAKLRNDLQQLYDAGFFLILPPDIENGLTRVPFNRRPIMITFDDGWEDNFKYIDGHDGQLYIDPDCALAIVNTFIEEHPDFGPGVLFFISWDKVPFGNNTQEKLNTVLDMGHCIGNHSMDHLSFMKITPSEYRKQIIPALRSFQRELGIRTSEINVIAYPGGRIPHGVNAEGTLASMVYSNRPAVVQGYLVDGAVSSFNRVYESQNNKYRISRIDMALYTVPKLLSWRNIMIESTARSSLHDDLPWRPTYSD